jgi:hypothetical protein
MKRSTCCLELLMALALPSVGAANQIPPGGNKVLLEPQGGWQGWLEHGRKPVRLEGRPVKGTITVIRDCVV